MANEHLEVEIRVFSIPIKEINKETEDAGTATRPPTCLLLYTGYTRVFGKY